MRLPQLPPPALARLAAAALTSVSLVCAPGALLALDPAPATTLAPPPAASPIYEEVAALVDKYYLDRTFNGVDFKGARERVGSRTMSESEALAEATSSSSRWEISTLACSRRARRTSSTSMT